jgi:hypothetical protein
MEEVGRVMKIVKLNNKLNPPKWHAQCTCGHCESVLDVEEEDLRHVTYDDGGREYIDSAVFQCPACENWNSIPNTDISAYVKKRLTVIEWESIRGGCISCKIEVMYHIQETSDFE